MAEREQAETLESYLASKVFAKTSCNVQQPREDDVVGFARFMENYKSALAVERAAVAALK